MAVNGRYGKGVAQVPQGWRRAGARRFSGMNAATRYSRGMRRVLLALFLTAIAAWAVNIKLYLKDGTFHVVREYQVESDRVRFYSVERSDWEEIPLDMVDLKRTESEATSRKAELEKEAKDLS